MGIKHIIRTFVRTFKPIKISGVSNSVKIGCRITGSTVDIIGNSNKITIPKSCKFSNTQVVLYGENNTLICDEKVRFIGPCTIIMEGNATLHLGENAGIRGVKFKIKEGSISVGKYAMFSYGINVMNHDSHRVFVGNEADPCNLPQDVIIGDHVWVCENSSILKGCNIGTGSIVAYGAVATRNCPPHSILAGNPAKIVKDNIRWDY